MTDIFSRSFSSSASARGLQDFGQVPPYVQHHIQNVYKTLCVALLAATAGVYLTIFLMAIPTFVGFLGAVGGIFWLSSTPASAANFQKRMLILCLIAFCKGIAIGPMVQMALFIDPMIIVTAFGLTAAVFGAFTVAALKADRRSYLYIGGVLGSALSGMFWLSLLNMFFRSPMILNVQIYMGLLVFSGYVVYDTQVMIERAYQAGQQKLDAVTDALSLFLDFAALFVRILIILMKNRQNNDNNRRRR